MCPFSSAKSTGRQSLLSRAFGSALYSISISTVSRKPILAASWSGVVPECGSWMLGSAPCSSSKRATDVLPIIITCSGVLPKQFTPLTSSRFWRRTVTRSVLPLAAADASSSILCSGNAVRFETRQRRTGTKFLLTGSLDVQIAIWLPGSEEHNLIPSKSVVIGCLLSCQISCFQR